MKVIVAGASGFLGGQIIKQCLALPQITTVIALARKAVSAPSDLKSDANSSKLRSLVIEDYGVWPDTLKQELSGAAACIWLRTPIVFISMRSITQGHRY